MRNRWQVVLSFWAAVIFISFASAAFATDPTLWTARYGGANIGSGYMTTAMAVDPSGNVYITGYNNANGFASSDYYTAKFDAAGNQLWVKSYNGPGNGDDIALAVVVDSSGNAYVSGSSIGIGTGNDYCTIKYDSSGNELWVRRYDASSSPFDIVKAMTIDAEGNIYVTGYIIGPGTGDDYCTIKYDSAGNELWVRKYNGPGNNTDMANAIAVDSAGNVYITGFTRFTTGQRDDYCTVKYDSAGNQVWVQTYNGPGNGTDQAKAIAVDSSGNAYVTGSCSGSGANSDYCTIKYDSAGNQVWAQTYNGPANGTDQAKAIAVDSSGDVYVTGSSASSSTASDYCTIKYSSAGNQLWMQRTSGSTNTYGDVRAIVVDSSGSAYVTGSRGTSTYHYSCTIKYDSAGNQLWLQNCQGVAAYALAIDPSGNVYVDGIYGSSNCIIKYTCAGDQLWIGGLDGPTNGSAVAVVADSSGNIYVTGYCNNNGISGYDYCTVKYDSLGNQLWVRKYDDPANGEDRASCVAVDSSGNVYVVGYSAGIGTGYDYCTVKYDSAGNRLWVQRYSGPGSNVDMPNAMAVDSSGNIYVTGYSYGSGTGYDYCTIKYDAAGNQLWVQRYNGPANDRDAAYAIAVDSSGNAYVTGESRGANYDYCTIKYGSSGNQIWVQRYSSPGNYYDIARDLALDSSGNIYVTGSATDYGCCTIKYDSAGNELWVRKYNGPGSNIGMANAIAVDSSGNAYITGHTSYATGQGDDYCTIKYDSAGNQIWVQKYSNPNGGNGNACDITVDSSGNAYVTGYCTDIYTYIDCVTLKYDSAGNQLWIHKYDVMEGSEDRANTIALGPSGNVYVTGYTGKAYSRCGDYLTIAYSGANPTGSVSINGGAQYTGAAGVSLNLSAIIGGGASIGNTVASMRFSNDGISWSDWRSYSSTMTWTLSSDTGVKTVYAQFRDSIGNVSQVYSDTIILSTVSTSKKEDDSSAVWVSGVVTAVFGDSFYLEAPDRSMAVRVDKTGHGMAAGNAVEVSGTILTDDMGERYVAANEITPGGNGSVSAVALTNRALGGGDYSFDPSTGAGQHGVVNGIGLNNIGLLVTISGEVSCLGSDFFCIDDGTDAQDGSACKGVKVICGNAVKPQQGQYVTVSGISSIMKDGDYYYRCLRMLPGSVIGKYN